MIMISCLFGLKSHLFETLIAELLVKLMVVVGDVSHVDGDDG